MDRSVVGESRRYLSEIGVWPALNRLNIDGWFSNFSKGRDTELAAALLDSHVHINEEQIVHSVASTLNSLSANPCFATQPDRRAAWVDYLGRALISFPLSRAGDPTASGYIFARIAERIGFSEAQIFDHERLLTRIRRGTDPVDVILFDDISATGTQFCRAWTRNFTTSNGKLSLADAHARGALGTVYFIPLVATQEAKERIESSCGAVMVEPTYLLDADYGALSPTTRLVPPSMRAEIPAFLDEHSPRTGKNDYGNAGFGNLGLALSFHHGCPNNTLPVLQWGDATADWIPQVT